MSSLEYRYVAYKFGKTINERNVDTLNIKKTFKRMLKENLPESSHRIQKIEKIFNYAVFERFENEMKKILSKNKNRDPLELMRHLFYGNK